MNKNDRDSQLQELVGAAPLDLNLAIDTYLSYEEAYRYAVLGLGIVTQASNTAGLPLTHVIASSATP